MGVGSTQDGRPDDEAPVFSRIIIVDYDEAILAQDGEEAAGTQVKQAKARRAVQQVVRDFPLIAALEADQRQRLARLQAAEEERAAKAVLAEQDAEMDARIAEMLAVIRRLREERDGRG